MAWKYQIMYFEALFSHQCHFCFDKHLSYWLHMIGCSANQIKSLNHRMN